MIELLTAMGILGIVMTSLTTVLVSATNADVRMNQNFQAQTQARMALDRFRREGHAACRADPAGADDVDHAHVHHLRQLPRLGRAAGELVHGCGRGESVRPVPRHRRHVSTRHAVKVADYLMIASAFNYQTTSQQRPQDRDQLSRQPVSELRSRHVQRWMATWFSATRTGRRDAASPRRRERDRPRSSRWGSCSRPPSCW